MDGSCLRVDLWGMMPVFDFMIVRGFRALWRLDEGGRYYVS
ncbi:MAG: hypothetical protein QW680_12480 [Pyrobaculum sp.]